MTLKPFSYQENGFSPAKIYTETEINTMSKCKLKKYERETIIVFNEAEPKADIYTYNTSLKNRLAKFTKEHPDLAKCNAQYPCGGVSYTVDKKRLSIRLTAPYSEERKAKARKYAKDHNLADRLNMGG